MYSVIVVDDEPTAIDYVRALIGKKAPEFEITAIAGNGQECLELISKKMPDIVISDIKMPVMDGIELIKIINSDYPQIMTLLISGYEEFEYAQKALKYNAVDYIKKPIVPRIFADVMTKMQKQLDRVFSEERNKTIRDLTKGVEINPSVLKKYFPDSDYFAILIRKNGLPRRFLGTNEVEVFSEVYESIIVYGRDEMESLYLITKNMLLGSDKKTLSQYIDSLLKKDGSNAAYTTTIATREPIQREDFSNRLRMLYRVLDVNSTIGKNQIIFAEDCSDTGKTLINTDKKSQNIKLIKALEHYLTLQQTDKAKHEIRKLFTSWKAESKTQLQVEEMVNQILFLFRNYGKAPDYGSGIEYDIEDAFYTAPSMDVLAESLELLLFYSADPSVAGTGKIDTPEFFNLIKSYIKTNMSQQLSLQSVSKEFGISQTYLSKLFRKYEDKSFNNYLTFIRMEEAKTLMKNDPDLYIKDIASMVGYNDQFYFSRIFRSYTGMCPSDYLLN